MPCDSVFQFSAVIFNFRQSSLLRSVAAGLGRCIEGNANIEGHFWAKIALFSDRAPEDVGRSEEDLRSSTYLFARVVLSVGNAIHMLLHEVFPRKRMHTIIQF